MKGSAFSDSSRLPASDSSTASRPCVPILRRRIPWLAISSRSWLVYRLMSSLRRAPAPERTRSAPVNRVRPVSAPLLTAFAHPASSTKTTAAIRLGLPTQRRTPGIVGLRGRHRGDRLPAPFLQVGLGWRSYFLPVVLSLGAPSRWRWRGSGPAPAGRCGCWPPVPTCLAARMLAQVPCWTLIAGVADALLADAAGRADTDGLEVPPSLEDGLLSTWLEGFGWLLLCCRGAAPANTATRPTAGRLPVRLG